MSREVELAETFGDIARTLLAERDPEATFTKIVEIGLRVVDGAHHAGIDIVERKQIRAVATSDDIAERIDAIQIDVDEGPCLSALREHETFRTDDLAAEERWPRFAARAVEETGVRSIMGFRLFAEQDTFGAMNIYSRRPNAFDDEAQAIGAVLAAHGAVALSTARTRQQLEDALRTRDVIGQAKGMLMARGNIDEDAAFDILRRASQRMNLKLREVAIRVVDPDQEIDEG